MAITSVNVQLARYVLNVDLTNKTTVMTCTGTLKCINCKGTHAAFARECPVWKEEKEILNIKYSKNISFPEARQLVKQRHSNQENISFSKSYASVTTPVKEDCRTCTILARLILRKFPEMKNELKDILPMQTFSAISQETSSTTSTCSKPSSSVKTFASSSVPSPKVSSSVVNQTTGQSSSHDKPYIEWCFTPLLTVFQSYHGDISHYSCFPGFHQY